MKSTFQLRTHLLCIPGLVVNCVESPPSEGLFLGVVVSLLVFIKMPNNVSPHIFIVNIFLFLFEYFNKYICKARHQISFFFYSIFDFLNTFHQIFYQVSRKYSFILQNIVNVRICCCCQSVLFDSCDPHGLQHGRFPCPSPSPRAYSNSCPLS